MKKTKRLKKENAFVYIITIILYIPIILTVIYSFNASKISSVWGGLSLTWYEELLRDKGMHKAVYNSVILASVSTILANIIGIMGALGVKNRKGMINKIFSTSSIAPIMIPEIILGMAFLAMFSFAGIRFGMLTLILGHTAFCVPYIFIIVRARLQDMDPSIEEAARDLGAKPWQVFWNITFPAILPAVIAGTLQAFAMSFDDVVISIFVTGATTNTMAIKVYTMVKTGVTPEVNALATILLAIVIVLFGLGQIVPKIKNNSYSNK